MAEAALAARVVEVLADLGPSAASRYRYGSGCIVRGGTVLTAAHVVTDSRSVVVRDPAKREYAATVNPRFVGDADGPRPDLALLEIDDPAFGGDLPPMRLATVHRDSATGEPVERCHAVGYPWFAETRSRIAVRDTADAIGTIPVLSKLAAGLLSLQVTVAPRALPPQEKTLVDSEWQGMSGAPVVAGGFLLGVVTEHAPREGPSAITAVPLSALQPDPAHEEWGPGVADPGAWWSRLGVQGIGDLQRLPVPSPPRPEPAYHATLREFGSTLHQRMPQLLGRQQELEQIAAFATGSEGYQRLVAGAFTGKTALLYEAVTVGLPPNVDVVCYFLSRRASDATYDRFLAAVVPQLAYLCEVDPPVASVDQYHALWQQAVVRAALAGRHLLLVVDGLDEDLLPPRSPSVASLLPALVNAHAHVLVASRPTPGVPDLVLEGHPLKTARATDLGPFEGAQQLAEVARHEIYDLTHGDDADLAVEVLGVLTAAAGPLSLRDLVALRSDGQRAPTAADKLHVRRLVEDRAARSLERVGPAGKGRYQFAHGSLLEHAQANDDLNDPEFLHRIHQWADSWRAVGWPPADDGEAGTPRYLLDTYPSTLTTDSQRLAELVCDVGWIEAAVQFAGVDRVLADLQTAAAASPASTEVATMLAVVTGQAYNLRPPRPLGQPGYILRQLCLQAAELAEDRLADEARGRLQSRRGPCLIPVWTTRRASRALSGELGRAAGAVAAVAVLPSGQVVTVGHDLYGRVQVWDPGAPGATPAELGPHEGRVAAVAVLPDGRLVTCSGGLDGRILVWNPAAPSTTPARLSLSGGVGKVAVLPGGRVVIGGSDGRMLLWDPDSPGTAAAELGHHHSYLTAMAVLPGGRLVTGSGDGRLLVWDPDTPGAAPAELDRHHTFLTAGAKVAVLPGGRLVTFGGGDGRVLVWDPDTPGASPAELGRHDGRVSAVAVLADGRLVTVGDWDGRVLMWDLDTPGISPAELGRHDGPVYAVAVLPSGRVITGGSDGRVLVWDPDTHGTALAKPGRKDGQVAAVAVLPSGRVVTGGLNGRVLVWDPDTPGAAPVELGRHGGEVKAVAVLPSGRVVTVGDVERQVPVWDPDTPGAAPVNLVRPKDKVTVVAMAVLPSGRVVTGGLNGRVLVWDPDTPGAAPVKLGRHKGMVHAMAVLPSGRVVTGGWNGRVLVWDPDTPGAAPVKLGRHKHKMTAVAMAVLPSGRVVTGGDDGRVLVWDPDTPGAAPVKLGRHKHKVTAVAMAVLPSGQVVTSGGGQVLVWDPSSDPGTDVIQLNCSVSALATASLGPAMFNLVIAHGGNGFSLWSVTG